MAYKYEIRYVQPYNEGSAARQMEVRKPQQKTPFRLVQILQQEKVELRIDPLAAAGIVVAAVMLILMLVGVVQLRTAKTQMETMQVYVNTLSGENAAMREAYSQAYDLADVRRTAAALGMVPKTEVEQISIRVDIPVEQEDPTLWEKFTCYVHELFA